jgi:hypothetical protein
MNGKKDRVTRREFLAATATLSTGALMRDAAQKLV